MRWWLACGLALLGSMMAGGPTRAQEWFLVGEEARFQALAQQHQARRLLSWSQVQAAVSRYQGTTLVLKGVLRGQITTAKGALLIFHLDEGSKLQIRLSQSKVPMAVGSQLQLLVRVGSEGEAQLLGAAYDTGRARVSSPTSGPQAGESTADAPGEAAVEEDGEEPALPEEYARTALSSEVGERLARAIHSSQAASSQRQSPNRSASPSRGNVALGIRQLVLEEQRQALGAVRAFNARLPEAIAQGVASRLLYWSRVFGLRWQFLAALVAAESNFNPNATSSKGAMGLGQLMPGTASSLGVSNAYDIDQNLYGSARYIRTQLDRYRDRPANEQFALALAAYNAGPGAVSRHGGVPPYRETVRYIQRVADYYIRLCQQTGVPY